MDNAAPGTSRGMSDEPMRSGIVPAWQAGWRMTEAKMPASPVDTAWRKRLAFRFAMVPAFVALGTIVSFILWMVLGLILMFIFFGSLPPLDF